MARQQRMENTRSYISQSIKHCLDRAQSRDESEEVIAVALVTVASFFETPEVAIKFLMEVSK